MSKKLTVQQQVIKALDGRSQRWLALEIKMPEANLSKKMRGKDGYVFTDEDIVKINRRLSANIVKG